MGRLNNPSNLSLSGCGNSMRTVRREMALTDMPLYATRNCGTPSVINLVKVKATSAAVMGVPSWKRARALISTSTQRMSAGKRADSAISG
ncbi:hypothetical protein D3C78_1535420 [compost metagenome]